MTDTEIQLIANQVAAANRQLIIEEIDKRFRLPTGVVSGGPYGSFSVNDQGQIIEAGAASGSVPDYAHGDISAGTSFSASSFTTMGYSGSGFTSSKYTAPYDGKFHWSLYFRAGSAAWTAGDELRIYEVQTGTGGATRIKWYRVVEATRTMFFDAVPHGILPMVSGNTLEFAIWQTRSGGSITVDLTFVDILGFAN